MDERVTWLIPVKNGMPYLPETLASIEAQTYNNWEVLVWDNGSTDGTLEELEKWIPSRLAGRVITNEPYGVGGSLARMVEECKTELCARIDADDINVSQRLEHQVSYLAANPDVAVVGGNMHLINSQGEVSDQQCTPHRHHDDIVHMLMFTNGMAHPSVMFRRSAILHVGNYRELSGVEDYDLWLRVATQYRLANLDLPLVYYRVHSRSTTQLLTDQNTLEDLADDCVARNAPLLFGCTEDEIRLLRRKRHLLAIQPLYKVATHLCKTQGGGLFNRLKSDSFTNASRNLVSPVDVISCLAIASLKGIALTTKLQKYCQITT